MQFTDHGNGIFTVANFFTPEMCAQYIQQYEDQGFEEAKVNFGKRAISLRSVRNNERIIEDNPRLAAELWERIKPFVPAENSNAVACGLNERFRFYKYVPGQEFKAHQDGSYIRNTNEWSVFTFMVYLNEGMEGGATIFNKQTIIPETGKALIFKHELLHAGQVVTEGVKYVLRTDIMYRRKA